MFQLIVAALSGTNTIVGASDITANWSNISTTSPSSATGTTVSTVVFTGGGSRQLLFEHDVSIGKVKVDVDGVIANAPSGYTVYVTTGQLVTISYTCAGASESATLTIKESTPGMGGSSHGMLLSLTKPTTKLIDTITLTFAYTGF